VPLAGITEGGRMLKGVIRHPVREADIACLDLGRAPVRPVDGRSSIVIAAVDMRVEES
jgi:hypothetical protein